ncbi:hypothetical protein PFICI_01969 [Pestalotiopsis fici W106-1]|uniref:Uncharacterized protein n=1 Tax=Pestalotiopsis fici (strain W106-1 / CGMCC3.15140) TaxID=1229662 RepID=W3XSE1_PESFW|nr:uncharacterized protein PFICI_01969 [Pestalotiopsis fici W106-1]ETS88141.1 hypothetical protein PFICI_01969 [Pestalotiopsis fici W106-1]
MRLHLRTYLDMKKYGPVLRHGPNKLIFNSAEALQDIYNNEKVGKSRIYNLTVISGKPSIFNVLDKSQHRIKRKLIGQAVSDKAMRAFEPTMAEQVDIFIGQLTECSEKEVHTNMTERFKCLGMDTVGLLAFGFPLNMQTDPTYRFVIRGLNVGGYQNHCFMQYPMLKKLGLHKILVLLGKKQRQKYLAMLQLMIGSRLAEEPHAKNDLYSSVFEHLDNTADGIATSQLWSEALFLFPAGGDTTATALSALFFYLSRHSDVYSKLAHEIRSTFSSASEIRGGSKLAGCKYLRASIDEALRMSPSVSGTLWRELSNNQKDTEPFIVDGHVIPPGTQVGVSTYCLHHNEKYFPQPFEFSPERWLVEDEAALRLMNSAFCPFSIGARACAGKAMAYLEMSLVVAKTLYKFDFDAPPGDLGRVGAGVAGRRDGRDKTDEFQLYDIFAAMHDGPNLIFRPRANI